MELRVTMLPRRISSGAIAFLVAILAGGLLAAAEVSSKPLRLTTGGTADKPAVFDGGGLVIDLGSDVTDHAWDRQGDVWTSGGPLPGDGPRQAGQLAGLFIDEVPVSIPRDLAAEKLHPEKKGRCYVASGALLPGQMGYLADGSVVFRWPAGKIPGKARIIAPPATGTSCVTIACSHIVVRNVTAKHAANDGFNIHGGWVGIRLENVRAISNADEGISAHGDVQMDVIDAEVAWNGSAAAGVADIGQSVTSYRQCTVHNNLGAAFYFNGRSHRVEDTLIYDQGRDFAIQSGTSVDRVRVTWRK
jgi:hypothetical protein